MSAKNTSAESAKTEPLKTTPRPPRGGPGGPHAGQLPPEKAMHFRASLKRLARRLGPEKWKVFLVIFLGAGSVALAVIGPKVLGEATTVIFEAFLTGTGIDFDRLNRTLIAVAIIYVGSSVLMLAQGWILNAVTQRTILRLRTKIEDKVDRKS